VLNARKARGQGHGRLQRPMRRCTATHECPGGRGSKSRRSAEESRSGGDATSSSVTSSLATRAADHLGARPSPSANGATPDARRRSVRIAARGHAAAPARCDRPFSRSLTSSLLHSRPGNGAGAICRVAIVSLAPCSSARGRRERVDGFVGSFLAGATRRPTSRGPRRSGRWISGCASSWERVGEQVRE
jgi:hypothetical protein